MFLIQMSDPSHLSYPVLPTSSLDDTPTQTSLIDFQSPTLPAQSEVFSGGIQQVTPTLPSDLFPGNTPQVTPTVPFDIFSGGTHQVTPSGPSEIFSGGTHQVTPSGPSEIFFWWYSSGDPHTPYYELCTQPTFSTSLDAQYI